MIHLNWIAKCKTKITIPDVLCLCGSIWARNHNRSRLELCSYVAFCHFVWRSKIKLRFKLCPNLKLIEFETGMTYSVMLTSHTRLSRQQKLFIWTCERSYFGLPLSNAEFFSNSLIVPLFVVTTLDSSECIVWNELKPN